jgi:hypothetical protein
MRHPGASIRSFFEKRPLRTSKKDSATSSRGHGSTAPGPMVAGVFGFVEGSACPNVFLYFVFVVRAEFVVEFGFDSVALKDGAEAEEKIAKHFNFST